MSCEHKKIKKNWPFGRNSTPTMFCLGCKEVITPHDRMLQRRQSQQLRKRYQGNRNRRR